MISPLVALGPPQAEPDENSDADEQAQGPPVHVQRRRRPAQVAAPTGIRALQAMGLQLLTAREENEFILRQKELDLQRRKLEHEEKRLALEERKLALEEGRLKLQEQQNKENAQLMSTIRSMLEEQGKQISSLLNLK